MCMHMKLVTRCVLKYLLHAALFVSMFASHIQQRRIKILIIF